jgi:hypothetical protein
MGNFLPHPNDIPRKTEEEEDKLTARLLTVNVGIQPFGTHFGNLLRLAAGHVVEEATQVDACVQRTQLLLVQMQHLVHTPLVLQLYIEIMFFFVILS